MTDMTLANKTLETLVEKMLYPGRIFQLIINNGLNNNSTYPVKVEQLDENWLVLSPLEGKEQFMHIKPGCDVIGICKSDNNIPDYIFNSQLMEIKPSPLPRIYVKRPLLIHSSRRRFFRLDVNLALTCFKGEKKITGVITNLSAGGMCSVINYDQPIECGVSLACQFTLPNATKPMLLIGKVIRIQKLDDQQEIALHFQLVDKSCEALITSFLFQHQRKLMNETRKKLPEDIIKTQPPQFRYLAG